jgi:hypothetical protein
MGESRDLTIFGELERRNYPYNWKGLYGWVGGGAGMLFKCSETKTLRE